MKNRSRFLSGLFWRRRRADEAVKSCSKRDVRDDWRESRAIRLRHRGPGGALKFPPDPPVKKWKNNRSAVPERRVAVEPFLAGRSAGWIGEGILAAKFAHAGRWLLLPRRRQEDLASDRQAADCRRCRGQHHRISDPARDGPRTEILQLRDERFPDSASMIAWDAGGGGWTSRTARGRALVLPSVDCRARGITRSSDGTCGRPKRRHKPRENPR